MGRRAKPAKAKVEAKPSVAPKSGKDDPRVRDLEKRLAEAGEGLKVAAHHGPIPSPTGRVIPVVRGSVAGRAVLERRPVQVADLQEETRDFALGSALAPSRGRAAIERRSWLRCSAKEQWSARSTFAASRKTRSPRSRSDCSKRSPIRQ